MNMKKKTVFGIMSALALSLLLCACSSNTEKLAVSDPEYSDYVGSWFRGNDPWDGELTVMIKSIVDGKMEWTFTDSFEGSTLYQEIRDTELKENAAVFDVQGKDAENKNTSFHYQGTMELKNGAVVMTFEDGEVMTASSEGGSSARMAKALADSGLSNTAVLAKPDPSQLNTYTVKEGDSIHSIAKQYGISTKELAIMNQTVIIETAKAKGYEFDDVIEYAKYLFPGEVLTVPAEK